MSVLLVLGKAYDISVNFRFLDSAYSHVVLALNFPSIFTLLNISNKIYKKNDNAPYSYASIGAYVSRL